MPVQEWWSHFQKLQNKSKIRVYGIGCSFPTSRLRTVNERFQVVDGKCAGKCHGSVVTFVNVFVSWQKGC